MLSAAEPHLERNVHPTVICRAFMKALDDAVEIINGLAFQIDFDNKDELLKVVDSCIATKLTRRFGMLIPVCCLHKCARSMLDCKHSMSSKMFEQLRYRLKQTEGSCTCVALALCTRGGHLLETAAQVDNLTMHLVCGSRTRRRASCMAARQAFSTMLVALLAIMQADVHCNILLPGMLCAQLTLLVRTAAFCALLPPTYSSPQVAVGAPSARNGR